ncbi:hypothetical protein OXYTRIMIC_062 [Oxytricha trifallax]|uniref:Ubiquitin-like protease family profile domain-containing protein n=1 Tax=Oxytricha trifallax TaxID=1172189 RepID=A0A073I0E3_9SPIT|nr:hypothetical protein OXYTRIMIC_062 [Oxytricha trifallax]
MENNKKRTPYQINKFKSRAYINHSLNGRGDNKREFWDKVKEVRFQHRDRSKDQETLEFRGNRAERTPLNRQGGFKRRLKLGHTNPSKKINESQPQRQHFDKHEYGTTCAQSDQMKMKQLIGLSKVQSNGSDKIIPAKKGWSPQITKMTTIECCPSTRSKIEKALMRRLEDREEARRRGTKESYLWTERQKKHWKDINKEWIHEDLMSGKHIKAETLEVCMRQIEKAQFNEGKTSQVISPISINDKGISHLDKCIGSINWKLENCKYWRSQDDTTELHELDNNENNQMPGETEIYDTRRLIGSLAEIQKHIKQLNEVMTGTMGQEFQTSRIIIKQEINQTKDPEDCGLLAILIANHLADEIPGELIFQIFAKDWLNMQRYYLIYNFERGYMRMEFGKSGRSIKDSEVEANDKTRNKNLWSRNDNEIDTEMMNLTQIDAWEDLVQKDFKSGILDKHDEEDEGQFSEDDRNITEIEGYLFKEKSGHEQGKPRSKSSKVAKEMVKSLVPAKIPTVPNDQAVESIVQEENEKQSRDDKQESLAPDEEETQKNKEIQQ